MSLTKLLPEGSESFLNVYNFSKLVSVNISLNSTDIDLISSRQISYFLSTIPLISYKMYSLSHLYKKFAHLDKFQNS